MKKINSFLEQEVPLTEALLIFKKYIYVIIIIPLLATCLAFIFLKMKPVYWYGEIMIMPGGKAQLAPQDKTIEIEPIAIMTSRISSTSFHDKIRQQVTTDNLKPDTIKGLDDFEIQASAFNLKFVQIVVKSSSLEAIKILLPLVSALTINYQTEELKPIYAFYIDKIKKLKDDILRRREELKRSGYKNVDYTNKSEAIIREIEKELYVAEEKISPMATFPAKIINDYSYSRTPSKIPLLVIYFVLSLLLTLSAVFLIEILKYHYSKTDKA